ncbi:MAG: hypothetical protein AABW53_02645 [Nanoarchaeota archaeon]
MYTYSPVMDYSEAITFLAERILREQGESPYLVLVNGLPQSGKSHFCRDVVGAISFKKEGLITTPHDFERGFREHKNLRYYLIENHDAHLVVVNMETHKLLDKGIDFNIFILNNLAEILGPPEFSLERMLECFDLIVENPDGKFELNRYYR